MIFDILYKNYRISPYFNYWEYLPHKTLAYFEIHCPADTKKIFMTVEECMQFIDSEIEARK